jgi:hypothetical protein
MSTAPARTELNDRARGWLRYVWDKATTPDDWSSAGEPLPWWDRDSTAPMCSFPRFDLGETSYSLPLMADVTPAWREVYTRIGRELCDRHTTFWAASDWITLIGRDPNLERYPPEWLVFIPERLRGSYPSPGWTGNGIEPWGLQPDPIGADGNFFFRGFFNLLLSVYAYVSGDTHYREPFAVTGYQERRFDWTHQEIAEYISAQLAARPEGPHCENTKIWPFCVSAGGLGLKLFDAVNGTSLQRPYDGWVEFARQHYMGLDKRGELDWFALYYDPLEQQVCNFANDLTGYGGLCITPYVTPQNPEFGAKLYELSVHKLGWSNPQARINQFLPDPRFIGIALMMAHELGDTTTAERLQDYAEREFEPRFFGDEDSRFGFFFGYGEEHPRGQQSALMVMPEVGGRGAWSRVFNAPNLAKLVEPTVEGIDYPSLGVSVARNDHDAAELHVRTYAATPSHAGRTTTWRVTQLPDPDAVRVTCDGQEFTGWRVSGPDAIELTLDVGDHDVRVRTGYRPGDRAAASAPAAAPRRAPVTGLAPAITAPSTAAVAAVSSCRCC